MTTSPSSIFAALLAVFALSGCMSAADHRRAVQEPADDRLTVGKVQREIRVGMSSAKVIEVLGSPNIVTTDREAARGLDLRQDRRIAPTPPVREESRP